MLAASTTDQAMTGIQLLLMYAKAGAAMGALGDAAHGCQRLVPDRQAQPSSISGGAKSNQAA
jgi:hypothetical protein